MNRTQEKWLRYLASQLSRSDGNNNPVDLPLTESSIRNALAEIYKDKIDVRTVLKVEQILNSGYANVARNTRGAKERMAELAEKAAIGLDLYRIFNENPKQYVASVEMANRGIGKCKGEGRRFVDGVPIEPVRAAFVQFREELRTGSNQAGHTLTRQEADKSRFDATIAGERFFLGEYLAHGPNEWEDKKPECLRNFDKRMEKLTREIEREREQ